MYACLAFTMKSPMPVVSGTGSKNNAGKVTLIDTRNQLQLIDSGIQFEFVLIASSVDTTRRSGAD